MQYYLLAQVLCEGIWILWSNLRCFRSRMTIRDTVTRGRRCIDKPLGPAQTSGLYHSNSPFHVGAVIFKGSLDGGDNIGQSSQVKNPVDPIEVWADHLQICHIHLMEGKAGATLQVSQIFQSPSGEVIQHNHLMPLLQEQLGKMASDEPCSAGYNGTQDFTCLYVPFDRLVVNALPTVNDRYSRSIFLHQLNQRCQHTIRQPFSLHRQPYPRLREPYPVRAPQREVRYSESCNGSIRSTGWLNRHHVSSVNLDGSGLLDEMHSDDQPIPFLFSKEDSSDTLQRASDDLHRHTLV